MDPAVSNVLIDRWSGKRSGVVDMLAITGFALLTALLSLVRIPLPFTPVPVTGQTFAVLLAGLVLGARRGFLSQALYLAGGAAGLPVFAAGSLMGPTAGYLWSFPLAAFLVGWLCENGAGRRALTLGASLVFADAVILVSGVVWLRALTGDSLRVALILGFAPFWAGDLLKIAALTLLFPPISRAGLPGAHKPASTA